MKRIIIILLMIMFSVSAVSAALSDTDIISYYKFDQSPVTDYTGLNNLTNNGVTLVAGKVGNASDFDGGTDYLEDTTFVGDLTEDFTIDLWLNFDAHQAFDMVVKLGGGDDDRFAINADGVTGNKLCIFDDIAHAGGVTCGSTVLNTGTYYYITLVFNATGDQIDLYINNNFEVNRSSIYNISQLVAQDLNLGASVITTSSYLNGKLDEVGFYNKLLTDSERAERYNAGTGNTPPFAFTPTITSDLQAYYNAPNISVNLNTTPVQNTNMSYVLDGGGETSICSNCNISQVNLTGLSDAVHNITWISTDVFGQVNTTENFTIDTIIPSLNVSLPAVFNFYTGFNFSQYINYSDLNIDTCTINISNNPATNCDEQNYNFTVAGNASINITVSDLAGNINSSLNNILFVNPYQYFRAFNIYNSTFVNNFNLSLNSATNYNTNNGTVWIPLFDFNINQNNTLTMNTTGFQTTEFTYFINLTSNLNETLNVTTALLYIQFRDIDTNNYINQTVTFTLQGTPFASNYSTNNGSIIISDISALPEEYEIVSNSNGYDQNIRFFTFTGRDNLFLEIFMVNESLTTALTIVVRDQFLEELGNIQVTVRRFDFSTNSYIAVDQGTTNSIGQVVFDLDFTKKYQFTLSDGVDTITTAGEFITQSPLFLEFAPTEERVSVTPQVSIYSAISFVNLTTNSSRGFFRWDFEDSSGSMTQGCLRVYLSSLNTETLVNQTCVSSSSATLFSDNLDITFGKTYIIEGIVIINSEEELAEVKTFIFHSFPSAWAEGVGFLFTLTLWLVTVLGAVQAQLNPIAIMLLAISPLFVAGLTQSLPFTIGAVFAFTSFVVYILLVRRRG